MLADISIHCALHPPRRSTTAIWPSWGASTRQPTGCARLTWLAPSLAPTAPRSICWSALPDLMLLLLPSPAPTLCPVSHSLLRMFGRPEQTLRDWEEELEQVAALQPAHVSLYELTLKPGTPAHRTFTLPADDEVADMYEAASTVVGQPGLRYPPIYIAPTAIACFIIAHPQTH